MQKRVRPTTPHSPSVIIQPLGLSTTAIHAHFRHIF